LLAKYTAQLAEEPDNQRLIRAMAELHCQLKEFEQALVLLRRLSELGGATDPSLDKEILAVALKEVDQRLGELDPDDVDFETDRQTLLAQRQETEINAARAMVERYPSDLHFRFELGQIFFRLGRINEAIAEFQKAQANPHRRTAALGYLGQCFSQRGLHDVAVRTLQKAIDEKTSFDEEKKELTYQLGIALEAMGRRNDAIEQFKKIYEVDIGYRDVGARVDAHYAGEAR
jgi:tetratricopeptide (TPR) repeat protein